ncbi:MAG: peptidylprolyl isomerase [Geobacteraceae bacterium]|nr:peptidylprolyl isomerase [Geobacteraceae bacterium]
MRKLLPVSAMLLCTALLAVNSTAETLPEKSVSAPAAAKEPQAKPAAISPEDTVAKIDTTTITRKELDRALSVLVAQNRIQQGSTPEAMKEAQKSALEQLVFAELIYQQGMKVAPADLEKQVEFKMAQNKSKFGTPAEFEAALKDSAITENELAAISRKDIVITNYIETKIAPSIAVTDEEIKKFYEDNKAGLVEEPQVKASHILIGVDSAAAPVVKAEAKAKAEAILKELKGGKDFAEAAKANSTCPSKDQGGDLGFFGKGQMVPAFEQAAFSMKPGELSDVVETQFGYHIIKVTEKKESDPPKLEELKDKITAFLKGQKTQKAVFDHVTKLRKESKVEILL